MFFLVLVLIVMRVVIIFSFHNFLKKHTIKVRKDVDGGENNTANGYMQRSDHQHSLNIAFARGGAHLPIAHTLCLLFIQELRFGG